MPPQIKDKRVAYVPIACGKCIECRRMKANEWKTRLFEEIKDEGHQWSFVTLTFSEKSLNSIRNYLKERYIIHYDYQTEKTGIIDSRTGEFKETNNPEKYHDDNAVATWAVRKFLERWRKLTKKSVKHWLITEKGHNGTKRIHLHGMIKSTDDKFIRERWAYGWVWIGKYVNNETINYIMKYVTKVDRVNLGFEGKILSSKGIGAKYVNSINFKRHVYKNDETIEYYTTKKGHKISLPVYYRNKAFTEEERENLWLIKLDKAERYVMGEKIDISTIEGLRDYENTLQFWRVRNKQMGYFNNKNEQLEKYLKINQDLNNKN